MIDTLKKKESLDDFYEVSELLNYDLTLLFYAIKTLKKRKHTPKELKRLIENRSCDVLHRYTKIILDMPLNDFKILMCKAKDKMRKEVNNNVFTPIDKDLRADIKVIVQPKQRQISLF